MLRARTRHKTLWMVKKTLHRQKLLDLEEDSVKLRKLRDEKTLAGAVLIQWKAQKRC